MNGPQKQRRLLRPLQLTAIFFFTVSGGPYGLEPLLNNVGPNIAILFLLFIPLLWSLPVMLMVLELNSLFPMNGGYYQWVKIGMGERWGFYEGWWTWLYALTDLAIYPVLFVEYLGFLFPAAATFKIPVCLAIVWICAGLNILGVQPVGRSSVALKIGVILPFLAMFLMALVGSDPATARTAANLPPAGFTGLSMGLFVVMWNFLGWDSASTIAPEVERPARSYLFSMFAALAVIIVIYIVAIETGILTRINPAALQEDGFPALGNRIGGWWLGTVVAIGGLASALGLFLSNLLAISRVPEAMALDRFFPRQLARIHPRFGTPHLSIAVCAIVVSGMVLWQFDDLLIIDVSLYSAALFPEFIALIMIRRKQPGLRPPFRIPLTTPGLIALALLPAICLAVAFAGLFANRTIHAIHDGAALFALIALLTGPAAWRILRRFGRFSTPTM
jgi:amino acid transporter